VNPSTRQQQGVDMKEHGTENSVKPPQPDPTAVRAEAEELSLKPPQASEMSVKPPQGEDLSVKPPQ